MPKTMTNPHGGKRQGSGRKPKEETCTINFRVKKRLKDVIKEHLRPIVKELDK